MKNRRFVILCIFSVLLMALLAGCQVGTSNIFVEPAELGNEYMVTYDCLGGNINTVERRTVYYAENSLLYEPAGASGMLIEPRNGKLELIGWYSDVTVEADGSYTFDEEDRWDFTADRIGTEVAPNKELTLYAYWAQKPTIYFVDAEDPSIVYVTWTIDIGNTMSRPTTAEPRKDGYTLLDYYYDAACTQKATWGANSPPVEELEVVEQGTASVHIYCKFIEGEYTRVTSAREFALIADDPAGSYLLANDIDFTDVAYTPVGADDAPFTGTLLGNGYALKNLSLSAIHKKTGVAVKGDTSVATFGIFKALDGATIRDVAFHDITITVGAASNKGVSVGILAATAKNTTISGCTFADNTITADGACKIDITAAEVASLDRASKLEDCTFSGFSTAGLTTSGQLTVIDAQ